MPESLRLQEHIPDAVLWQWHAQELETAEHEAAGQHLQSCAACQARARALAGLVNEMQAWHRSTQPSLAEQMQLLRALEARFEPREQPLARASKNLVRWLAPAIAVLAAVFILLGGENTAAEKQALENLLSQTREEQLLMTSNAEDLQQTLLELAFSTEEQ